MKKFFVASIFLLVTISLIGCSDMSKQGIGTVGGGLAGGLIGSQFGKGNGQLLAIGAGAILGAMAGNAIGKSMDDADKMKMQMALENNAAGQPAYWNNQKTGTRYKVVPTKNVTVGSNRYCREYRSTADIAGKVQQVYGTACRQPDGSWKVIK